VHIDFLKFTFFYNRTNLEYHWKNWQGYNNRR